MNSTEGNFTHARFCHCWQVEDLLLNESYIVCDPEKLQEFNESDFNHTRPSEVLYNDTFNYAHGPGEREEGKGEEKMERRQKFQKKIEIFTFSANFAFFPFFLSPPLPTSLFFFSTFSDLCARYSAGLASSSAYSACSQTFSLFIYLSSTLT